MESREACKVTELSDESGDATERGSNLEPTNAANDAANDGSQALCHVSFWCVPLQDSCRTEITKKGSASFQNKKSRFTAMLRQGTTAKGELHQLSKGQFYAMMSNGQKILWSWMALLICQQGSLLLPLPTVFH